MIDVSARSRSCAGAGTRGSTSASRRRAWRTGRWPTSRNRSANCSTTGAPRSWRIRAPPPARSRPSRRSRDRPDQPIGTFLVDRLIFISLQQPVPPEATAMVTVVQLVEHQVVILAVAGSSPVSHPEEKPPASPGGFSVSPAAPHPHVVRSAATARSAHRSLAEALRSPPHTQKAR